jgi:hypothetical protein
MSMSIFSTFLFTCNIFGKHLEGSFHLLYLNLHIVGKKKKHLPIVREVLHFVLCSKKLLEYLQEKY